MILDIFLSQGIKGLLKICVVVMKHYKPKFLEMSFDEILNFMSDLTKKEIFTCISFTEYQTE